MKDMKIGQKIYIAMGDIVEERLVVKIITEESIGTLTQDLYVEEGSTQCYSVLDRNQYSSRRAYLDKDSALDFIIEQKEYEQKNIIEKILELKNLKKHKPTKIRH